MRIGELLIMNGLISDEQLAEALHEQRRRPVKLGEILISKGFIQENQLIEALAFQLGVPFVRLSEITFDPSLLQLVPEPLARKHKVFPAGRDGGILRLAMVDPLLQEVIQDVQKATGLRVQPMITTSAEMDEALVRYYGVDDSEEALQEILQESKQLQASAIRLEVREHGLIIHYLSEKAAVLKEERIVRKTKQITLGERIKQWAGLSSGPSRLPQSGRFQVDVGDRPLDIAVSILPARNGENYYLSLSDPEIPQPELSELSLSNLHLKILDPLIRQASGFMVISGPPATGKSTLAYAILMELTKAGRNTITLENPALRSLPGVTQVEWDAPAGLTLSHALAAALHHRPDVVMIDGRMEPEVAERALFAARHGPFVMCAMPCNGVFDTLGRLMHMVRDHELLAQTLSGIVSRRLLRKVCKHCAKSVPAGEDEQRLFETNGVPIMEEPASPKGIIGNFRSYITAQASGKPVVVKGEGCEVCGGSGYKGMIAVHEVLAVDESLRNRIASGEPIREIERYALQNGFKSFMHDGLVKVREGLTTSEEVLKTISS